jgi:hypothetical protein
MPIANLKEIRKGNPIPASWLERVRRSILGSIVGAGGTRVTWRGNKLVIESGDYRARTDGRASRLVQFVGVNDSGVEIPARSFAEITAYNADGTLSLDKPSEDSLPAARLAIVGAAPIPATDDAGEKGRAVVHPATVGSQEVAYSGTAPEAGDSFGSVADSWSGEVDKTGFKATGANASDEVALVSPFSESYWKYYYVDWPPSQFTSGGTSGRWDSAVFTVNSGETKTVLTDWLPVKDLNTGNEVLAKSSGSSGLTEIILPIGAALVTGVGTYASYLRVVNITISVGVKFESGSEIYFETPLCAYPYGGSSSYYLTVGSSSYYSDGSVIVLLSPIFRGNISAINYKIVTQVVETYSGTVDYQIRLFTNDKSVDSGKHYIAISNRKPISEIPS